MLKSNYVINVINNYRWVIRPLKNSSRVVYYLSIETLFWANQHLRLGFLLFIFWLIIIFKSKKVFLGHEIWNFFEWQILSYKKAIIFNPTVTNGKPSTATILQSSTCAWSKFQTALSVTLGSFNLARYLLAIR